MYEGFIPVGRYWSLSPLSPRRRSCLTMPHLLSLLVLLHSKKQKQHEYARFAVYFQECAPCPPPLSPGVNWYSPCLYAWEPWREPFNYRLLPSLFQPLWPLSPFPVERELVRPSNGMSPLSSLMRFGLAEREEGRGGGGGSRAWTAG